MRTGLLCLLLGLTACGCATSAGSCQGPLQPINPAQSTAQSNAAPTSVEPGALVP